MRECDKNTQNHQQNHEEMTVGPLTFCLLLVKNNEILRNI